MGSGRRQTAPASSGVSDIQFRESFFQQFPNFFSGGRANLESIGDVRKDPQFRRLFGSGQLLPVQKGPDPQASALALQEKLLREQLAAQKEGLREANRLKQQELDLLKQESARLEEQRAAADEAERIANEQSKKRVGRRSLALVRTSPRGVLSPASTGRRNLLGN